MDLKWILGFAIIFVFLLILILVTKIKVLIDFYHGQDNDHLKVKIKALFGLVQYKKSIPIIKVDKDSPTLIVKEKVETGQKEKDIKEETNKFSTQDLLNSIQDGKELLRHVAGMYKIVRKFLSRIAVESLDWHTVVGVGDAAYTGMITGAFWTVKGGLLGVISTLMNVKQMPNVTITPSFQSTISQTSFKCMIRFRIGHAIFAGIKLIKFWKGGKPHFKTKPLSVLSGDKTKTV